MKHYLDVSKLSGYELKPVDIITFGSPCQDLSIAGKRMGVQHESIGDEQTTRSGLFMEAVRIIKEMREATNGLYPNFIIWENVPGAFSSSKGKDFRIVLESIARIVDETVSVPKPKKWLNAGYLEGDGWSIAWRVLDAKYHGVPQRRRRIFLVGDFAGQRAGEILFKCRGLPGYPAESGEKGERAADNAENGIGTESNGSADRHGVAYAIDNHPSGVKEYKNISQTLRAQKEIFVAYQIAVATQQGGAEVRDDGICPTITAAAGMSGNNQPYCCYPMKKANHYIVRKLTQTECARLQGFPDGWGDLTPKDDISEYEVEFWNEVWITYQRVVHGKKAKPKTKEQLIKWYNRLHTDSAEYKMWGNGVALPCVRVPMRGIAKHGAKTLGSLFDGSGGFPLAGVLEGITPVWSSEIEPYPIAVTIERFGDE